MHSGYCSNAKQVLPASLPTLLRIVAGTALCMQLCNYDDLTAHLNQVVNPAALSVQPQALPPGRAVAARCDG